MSVKAQSAEPESELREADGDRLEAQPIDHIPTDKVFHLLQNERRRAVLRYLRGTDGVVDMRQVVENVAAEEYDTDPRMLSSTERQRVYIALYQSHLPKLADFGVIEYDQSRGRVERTEVADELDGYLEQTPQDAADDDPDHKAATRAWDRYYGLAAVGGIALVLGGYLGLGPAGASAGFLVAGLVAAVFGTLAAAQWFSRS